MYFSNLQHIYSNNLNMFKSILYICLNVYSNIYIQIISLQFFMSGDVSGLASASVVCSLVFPAQGSVKQKANLTWGMGAMSKL